MLHKNRLLVRVQSAEDNMPFTKVRGININYQLLGDTGLWVALSPGGRRDMYESQFFQTLGKLADGCISNVPWFDPKSSLTKAVEAAFKKQNPKDQLRYHVKQPDLGRIGLQRQYSRLMTELQAWPVPTVNFSFPRSFNHLERQRSLQLGG